MTTTDWRGSPVHDGTTVVYPVRQSSHVTLVEGVVRDILPGEDMWGRALVLLEIERVREHFITGYKSVDPKVVKVNLNNVTVVAT